MSTFSEESINFETLFKSMTLAMRITRFHPDIKKDISWLCQFSFLYGNSFVIFCFLIYSTVFHDLKKNDIAQACANGVLGVVFGILTFQFCVMFYYQKDIKEIIAKMNYDYEKAKEFPKDEQLIVQQFVRKGKFVISTWVILSIHGASVFLIKAFVLMLYYTVVDEFKYVQLFDLTYPDVLEKEKDTLSGYIIVNGMLLMYDIYVMFMLIGFIPLGPVFMLHACGQLELTKKRVMTIFDNNNTDDEIIAQLKYIASSLLEIYSFLEKIKKSFKVLYELMLKSTIVILPISCYQVIESFKVGEFRIEFLPIITGGVILSSMPCYYSDQLMESGEQLRLELYICGWEKRWEKKSRKLILLLLLRTTPSLTIRTMFRSLCLDALTDVFHQAYAIFNVLNAANN